MCSPGGAAAVGVSRRSAGRYPREDDTSGSTILHGSYDYSLVALSITLALVAAYTALDLAGRVTAAQRRSKWFWLAGGATSMGLGIWAMHYIGMLAFSLPVPVLYHYPTVVLSLLAAIAASAVALFTASRERMSVASLLAGGSVMGGGIAAMHYIGMAAMRLPAMMQYRPAPLALSVGLAVVISLAALVLAFQVRLEQKTTLRKLLSALIMGSAIPLMHYTGMWAVRFYASDIPFGVESTVQISSLGIVAISLTSFLMMSLAIATAFLDRMLALRTAVVNAARDGEARLRMLAEAIPQIVWTATPEGAVDYCNQRWYELTGFTVEQTLGAGWSNGLHPDDRPVAWQNWETVLRTGEPLEMEYRLRNAAGDFLWYLVRAAPMRDSTGAIVKWFGSCTDIDDQMRHQAVLEEQIRQHTAMLMDANTRLQTEMRERALTQQELNLQSERMVLDLTERSNRSTNLAKMAELLHSCAAVQDACSVAAGMAPKVFPELRGALWLFTPSRETLEVAATWTDCNLPANSFGPQDCWALRTGRLHVVVAGDHTAECRHAAAGEFSYFCLPLAAHGEAIGILHFRTIAPGDLPQPMLLVASTFAEQLGLSVANIRLREALRIQAIRDPLTGLYNRRYLEEMMERETRRAVRTEQGLGVLMLDLDHFKNFNDTYGHDAGDTVLRETASFLLKSVRAEDIVCRFGGEEFVVILPAADLKVTQARAERIRSRLRELSVTHQGQSLGPITVSVGVAELPQHGISSKELLDSADAALYRAKREGRDRVMVADTSLAAAAKTT
jgi:diguanylate cyclase (GGDEF)-like protein/PAS domain S-box-containing protein